MFNCVFKIEFSEFTANCYLLLGIHKVGTRILVIATKTTKIDHDTQIDIVVYAMNIPYSLHLVKIGINSI